MISSGRALAAGLAALGVLALLRCGAGHGIGSAAAPDDLATVTAGRQDFRVVVRARGELDAVSASPVAVPAVPTGALKVKDLAPEGSLVAEGDVIVRFDDTQLGIELANHSATFRSSNRKIDRTRIDWGMEQEAIDALREVAELERDWASEFQLQDEDIYSRLEILEARLEQATAEERIVFADAKLLLQGEYYDIDERILGVEKEQAQGKMQRVETSLGSLVLTAPIPGMVVYRKNWRGATVGVGDSLWPGNVIMSIVDPTSTALKVNVLEKDASGVVPDAPAGIRIDAFRDRVFPGRVESVSRLARPIEQGSPVKYFEATVVLDDGDPDMLKPGMKGEAAIQVAELADAVVVPRSAVRGDEDEEPYVLVSADGVLERRPVTLGAGDLVRVEVTAGLDGGEQVLLGASPDGQPPEAAGVEQDPERGRAGASGAAAGGPSGPEA